MSGTYPWDASTLMTQSLTYPHATHVHTEALHPAGRFDGTHHHLALNPEKKRLMAGKTSGRCALTKRRKACWLYLSPSSAFSSTALCRLLLLTLNKAREQNG
mgnify:CR=1 FL=1